MKKELIQYTLQLADNVMILSHRCSEWCGHGPVLEQDIAITNIALDLIGQSRNFYQYAAQLMNEADKAELLNAFPFCRNTETIHEDSLAYVRIEREYTNNLLVELPNGDWGQTVLRLYLFCSFQHLLYQQLKSCGDAQLAAIAEKGIKELAYHVRWSSEWVIRLGDGTTESHNRMLTAIENVWSYTQELFEMNAWESTAVAEGFGIDLATLKNDWLNNVKSVFDEATLPVPENVFMHSGGKKGMHTEYLGYILTELQYMQRAYPNCEW